jgi:hypothetical protein
MKFHFSSRITNHDIIYVWGGAILQNYKHRRYSQQIGPIKTIQDDDRIKLAIIAANNHYAGFGPGTANVFRNMLGLPDAKWEDKGKEQEESAQVDLDVKQSTLSDFLD